MTELLHFGVDVLAAQKRAFALKCFEEKSSENLMEANLAAAIGRSQIKADIQFKRLISLDLLILTREVQKIKDWCGL